MKYLLGSKPNRVNTAANNASKSREESKQQSNGHDNIRSQQLHVGHLRVHQYRHH
jgi:hypothetical protein